MPLDIEAIKHYQILNRLGKGGMGEVYLAQDTVLNRKVAIKTLLEDLERDPQSRMRFLREARAAAALDHPFICKVYETGEAEEKAYIVMEFIEGQTLHQKLEEQSLSMIEAIQITLEIAEALDKAHSSNIIHRDLKPANIILTPEGHVKVMDFGLAKWVEAEEEVDEAQALQTMTQQATLTEQGAVAGTLAYMSPEQAKGKKLDNRSDIFALGLIFYEMTTGRHPFMKMSGIETLSAILKDPTPPPGIKPKSFNPILSPIFRKALAKNLDNRYQDIKEFIADLKKVQREITGGSRFLHKGLPIIVASVLITAAVVFAVLKFTQKPQAGSLDTGPEPISIIVADVQNQTGDAVFDGVLEKVLSLSLDGTSYISVYDSKQARQQATQLKPGFEGDIDIELAQLLSQRLGINVVLSASIEPRDSGYLIKAWAMDPTSSDNLAEVDQTINNKADILKAADVISAKLSAELGVVAPDSSEALIRETFTTTSLEAMKAYTTAQELEATGKTDEAINEYLKALDNDPNLGRAYSGLAAIYHNRQRFQEAEETYLEAMKRIDQMTSREKFRTRGGYYLMKRNYNKAVEELSALVAEFPLDAAGHTNLALAYFYAYQMEKSFEEGQRAVELNPHNIHIKFNLVWYAAAAGKNDVAEQTVRPIIENNPNFQDAYVILALVQLAQEKPDLATETYRKIEDKGDLGKSLSLAGLADLAIYEGRLNEAQSLLRQGISFDLEKEWNYRAADKGFALAHTYLIQGNNEQAYATAETALGHFKNEELMYAAAKIYIETDHTDDARALAGELNQKIQPIHQAYAKLTGGDLSQAREDLPGAISLYQESLGLVDTWLGHFLLGKAYLQAEQFTEAYSEFETCLNRRGETISIFLNDLPSFRYFPEVYYYLGRAQEGLGSAGATESYQKYLQLKAKADEQNSMIEDANQRLNSL